jgi:adenylosuccinate lyase
MRSSTLFFLFLQPSSFGQFPIDRRGLRVIARYTRPEMGRIWSDENKFRMWLRVEVAATETLAEAGMVPQSAAKAIRERGDFDLSRIQALEAEVKHDVIAFTTAVAEKVGPDARWLHFGLTSNDVVDTAQALQIHEASLIIRNDLEALKTVLKRRAFEFQHTPTIGRTHGIHAEPTTFGLKLANWYSETERNVERFEHAVEDMRVGKISGAVGTLAHLTPELEEKICSQLGLKTAAISSQVIQRDRHAFFVATLAVIASTLDKIAVEIRHLQRTEVREAEEYFSEKQKGSSAMPHKRNPIKSEQLCGLARVLRGNVNAALEDVALWHERDISHSSAERVIIADSLQLAHYVLVQATTIVSGLRVDADRMRENLDASYGLVFSQPVLLALVEAGLSRDDAYRAVQRCAMTSWETRRMFRDVLADDPEVTKHLTDERLDECFDLVRSLGHVGRTFDALDEMERTPVE